METDDVLLTDIQKSFFELLNKHLPKQFLENIKENGQIKILSIGCGRLRESKSVFDYFGDNSKNIKMYGIDLDKENLKLAEDEPTIKNHKNQFELKLADASNIENYKDWLKDGLFDLIIIRHPEITFNTDVFIEIFSMCPSLLKKDGYVLITTHFENEKDALLPLLKLLKFNLVLCTQNLMAPCVVKDDKTLYADKFLLIANI